ncbi:MAG: hypothetical protein QM680_14525, partial [Luteolibacter sp.]
MKPKRPLFRSRSFPSRVCFSFGLAASLFATGVSQGASDTWTGATSTAWATAANWSASGVPGTGDTATFNSAGNGNIIIDLSSSGVTVAAIVFDTASAAAYTIGSGVVGNQTLTLTDTSAITLNSTVTTSQLINANIILGTAAAGTTTITNNATTASGIAINIAGNITGGTGGTAGVKTIATAGTGAINLLGSISAGGASGIGVSRSGAGVTTLSGVVTGALNFLNASTSGTIVVNNASSNFTVAAGGGIYGSSSAYGKFILTAGTVEFLGAIQSATSSGALAGGDGMGFIINGGTFTAASVALGRTNNIGTSFLTAAASLNTNGFQVNGGIATVTGTVNISGSNSSASGQVSAGSLTVGGELQIGVAAASGRVNLFQVTGGTLTVTDTTGGGIVIGKGSATVASTGQLLLTGGTTTTEKITFGLSGGLADSKGNLTLNGASANLYLGSGGIVLA